MTPAGDRPQDVGRRHERRGAPSVETVDLLERYRATMRRELAELLEQVRLPEQLGAFDGDRPTLERRRDLWTLAVKLARELAAEQSDAGAAPLSGGGSGARPPAPKLTVTARRKLGQ